ncbi:MAG: response regulator [Hyphococcus sp.]|nr:MAG: response regulator [Marinicaulis sp.]
MPEELERILCIDDDEDILMVASMALETIGEMKVKCCTGGARALEVVESFHPEFILLDYMMPGMDGPATLDALRRIPLLDETPIAYMTARVQPSEIDEYLMAGASTVVPKPFDPMTLANEIRVVWENSFRRKRRSYASA